MGVRRFRIAPTPSGFIHAGNALNFRLTAARCAEANGILRLHIDDLDRVRVRLEYLQSIFDALRELEILWGEGPQNVAEHEAHFSQTFRLPRYEELLQKLAAQNAVFACECSRAQVEEWGKYPGTCLDKNIPLDTQNRSWRIKTPSGSKASFLNEKGARITASLSALNPYFVVRRRDGIPAYHIASLADDVDCKITDIVRGEDLRESTFLQAFLARILGLESFAQIRFEHHLLLLDVNGEKLSKSAGVKKGL